MPGKWEFNAENFSKAGGVLDKGTKAYSENMGVFANSLGKASAARWNAEQALESGKQAFAMQTRKAEGATGEFVNRQGTSGLRMSGSIMDVLAASENMGIADAYAAKLEYDMESINQKYIARAEKRNAKTAKTQANIGAASSIIGSVASFYTPAKKPVE